MKDLGRSFSAHKINLNPTVTTNIQFRLWLSCCSWFRLVVCLFILLYILLKHCYMDRVKRIWYLSPMRAAKVQASLRIRAVSPEPPLLAHTSSESRGTFRQKARSLAPLNGWACAVKICHDGMLEDTNSLDGAYISSLLSNKLMFSVREETDGVNSCRLFLCLYRAFFITIVFGDIHTIQCL